MCFQISSDFIPIPLNPAAFPAIWLAGVAAWPAPDTTNGKLLNRHRPPEATLTKPPGPLRSRNFRLLLACDVISASGTAVATVALPFAVLRIGGSASDVGYVAVAYLVPLIGFLLLGVVADRLPRHQVMVAANALQALAQAASAVLLLAGHTRVWELAILAAARGIGTGFYLPASEGLLPHTVPADQRAPANALDRIGRNSGQIGGAALGGVLIGLAGPGWGLAADAVSFAVAAALRAGMRFPALPPHPGPAWSASCGRAGATSSPGAGSG
jgi:Transmembrane secretion effector